MDAEEDRLEEGEMRAPEAGENFYATYTKLTAGGITVQRCEQCASLRVVLLRGRERRTESVDSSSYVWI